MILICKIQNTIYSDSQFTAEQREDLNLPDEMQECAWQVAQIDLLKSVMITCVEAPLDEEESFSCAESNGCTRVHFETRSEIINVPFELMKIWYSKKNIDAQAEYSEADSSIIIHL